MAGQHLRSHHFRLKDADLVLRPLTEDDWDLIAPWNQDPEVLWFSEGGRVEQRSLEEFQGIYRGVSHTPADLFVFELDGVAVGDGWIQHMNLARILEAFPDQDCRRIDLQLDRSWWGRGIGTRAIRLLTAHGFATGADLVFGCDIAADNPRSQRAFLANRYVPWRRLPEPEGAKVSHRFNLVCRRDYFEGRAAVAEHPGPDKVRAGDEPFGAMVVVYRRSPELELLVLHRAAQGPDYDGDWAWTPPAGARFPAEPPPEAVRRELHEEIGVEAIPERLEGVGGSAWLIYSLEVGPDVVITLDDEHDRYQWVTPEEALAKCWPELVNRDLLAAIDRLKRS
jgi:RimJ/RimL family protein N-acetyltransferase/8-oxo-dGTP pyrophosphatase MutT (NUDIX family)